MQYIPCDGCYRRTTAAASHSVEQQNITGMDDLAYESLDDDDYDDDDDDYVLSLCPPISNFVFFCLSHHHQITAKLLMATSSSKPQNNIVNYAMLISIYIYDHNILP